MIKENIRYLKTQIGYSIPESLAIANLAVDRMLVDRAYKIFETRKYSGRIEGNRFVASPSRRGTLEVFGEISEVGSEARIILSTGVTRFQLIMFIIQIVVLFSIIVINSDTWFAIPFSAFGCYLLARALVFVYSRYSKCYINKFHADLLNEIEFLKIHSAEFK